MNDTLRHAMPFKSIVMMLYRGMLRLYPAQFRDEFALEMQDVFSMALDDAIQQGAYAFLKLWALEIIDLPLALLREYQQTLTDDSLCRARWIARLGSLLLSLFLIAMTYEPDLSRLHMINLLILTFFVILLGASLIAWRWEIAGGIVLTTSAMTLGLVVFLGLSNLLGLNILAVIGSLLWMLPHLLFGLLFIAVGRQTLLKQQHQP